MRAWRDDIGGEQAQFHSVLLRLLAKRGGEARPLNRFGSVRCSSRAARSAGPEAEALAWPANLSLSPTLYSLSHCT